MVPVVTPLIAVLLPIIVLVRRYQDRPVKRAYLYSVGSFTSALLALCMEIATIRQRALAGDLGGIEDTVGAVLLICGIIIVTTVILNLLALTAAYKEE